MFFKKRHGSESGAPAIDTASDSSSSKSVGAGDTSSSVSSGSSAVSPRRQSVDSAGGDTLDLGAAAGSAGLRNRKQTTSGLSQTAALVKDLVRETAVAALKKESRAEAEPALNLLTTTPKNFSRFVQCVTPLFDAVEAFEELTAWKDKTHSAFAWALFALCCYYPLIPAIAPLLLSVAYLASNDYRRTRDRLSGTSAGSSSDGTGTQAKTTRNLTRIQNSMGMYCDVVTAIRMHLGGLSLSSNERAAKALILISAAVTIVLLVFPLRLLIFLSGSVVLVSNTAVFRALVALLLRHPRVRAFVSALIPTDASSPRIPTAASADGAVRVSPIDSEPTGDVMVETYENQRWWVGLEWIDKLFPYERPHYSDGAGKHSRPKSGFSLVPGYMWEDEWRLVVDSYTDEEGWMYGDNNWEHWGPEKRLGTYTRRRKWIRRMVPIPS